MKFLFPQNYNKGTKLLGFIDYSTAILNIIIWLLNFAISGILFKSFSNRIVFFIIGALPITLFSIIGFNHENIVYVIRYIIKYYRKPKLYLYKKCN